jgi:hypothetical protein
MTKKICFVLIFAIAGIVSVNAQMRIGGSETPNRSAVLDLNPDDRVSEGNATLGLALPRVNLRNSNNAFPLVSHIKGMTVYNVATAGDVTPGVYVNNGMKWLRQADSEPDFTVLGDSIVNYITQNFSATALGDSISYYITQNFETLNLGDTIMQFITNNLDSSALMDSVANYISNNNAYLTQLIDNIAQNVYNTTLGDSIVNYISNQISNTLLGDTVLQYITENITNTVLGDSIINIVHNNELDGVVGNEVTDATANGGLIRSGAGTTASPYTLGIANGGVTTSHLANNSVDSSKIADGSIATADLADNAVTSSKIADGAITNADINASAGIALSKIALPDAAANNGKVLKSNGTAWIAGEDNNTVSNTTYSAGSGLTLSGTTFSIGTGQVNGTMIADGTVSTADLANNAVTSAKIADNSVTSAKIVNRSIVNENIANSAIKPNLIEVDGDRGFLWFDREDSNNTFTDIEQLNTNHLANNSVTSAKIADGTITNADINASAAIDLTKIALPNAAANNGKVLKSNGIAWVAGEDNNTVSNTTYSAGSGLTLSGTTFSIGTGQVNSAMIADGTVTTADLANNAVTSEKIANGTIKSEDLNSMGASEGNVLTFTNNSWLPKPVNLDGAVTFLGTNDETYSPIPAGTYSAGQVLSIFIKIEAPAGYSYYVLIPYSTANAMFPAFASTMGNAIFSRHIIFTKSTSYSSFNVKYLIFGVK